MENISLICWAIEICFRKCQPTIPRIFLFDGCEADTSQHSPRKSNVPSWVLKYTKQTPLVWSLTSEFYPSGTPIPPILHFLPCAAAPHAPRLIMPSRCYELKGWHCGHGGHGGNFSWLCSNLGVLAKNNDLNFCFPWKVFCIPCLPNLPPKNASFGTLLFLLLRPFRYPQLSFETCCGMPTLLTVASWSYACQLVHFQFGPKPPTQEFEDLYWMVCTWTAPTKLLLHEFVHEPPES